MMTIDPLSSTKLARGVYAIKAKALDSASGEILSESSGDWIVIQ
jgi:hypothetical protein